MKAYDILSDPEKKKLYDQFGHAALTVPEQQEPVVTAQMAAWF